MYYEPGVTPHGLPHDPFKSSMRCAKRSTKVPKNCRMA